MDRLEVKPVGVPLTGSRINALELRRVVTRIETGEERGVGCAAVAEVERVKVGSPGKDDAVI